MNFEFTSAGRIVFGRGQFDRVGELAKELGKRALVLRGGAHLDPSAKRLSEQLQGLGLSAAFYPVHGEPDIEAVQSAVDQARKEQCDLVIGLGGGAVLDAAKAVSGLLTQGGQVLDYLEVVGGAKPFTVPAAPLIAIPTTAGTGSEVTRNAVITCKEKSFKASMRSVLLIPRLALIDPALTDSMPPAVTASTGLDALTQLIEPYVCNRAQPVTDALSLKGISLVSRSLQRAFENGADTEARDDMALGSLLGGLCLANAGLGAVHGFAAPLGAAFPVPHGVACAALLAPVLRANVQALRQQGQTAWLRRYADVAQAFFGASEGPAEPAIDALLQRVAQLVQALSIPKLSQYGLSASHLDDLVQRAKRASSMRANPVVLSDAQLRQCLEEAL